MAIITPPAWAKNGTYTAQIDRLVLNGFLKTSGITSQGAYNVHQETPTTMNVVVSKGAAYINGADTTNQGWYHVFNDGDVALNIPASNATNPRIDLVYLRIYDQAYLGTVSSAVIEIQTGVPDPSPVVPVVTGTVLPLARVLVGAGVTSISNANITNIATVASFKDILTQNLALPPENWRNAETEGIIGANWTTRVTTEIPPYQYRLFNGCVEVRGAMRAVDAIDGSGGTVLSTILTLPSGYRPARNSMCKGLIENITNTSGTPTAGTSHTHVINETFRAVRVNVLTSGIVQLNVSHSTSAYRWSVPDNVWLSLNQLKFSLGLSV